MPKSKTSKINSICSAPELVETLDLIGTALCVVGVNVQSVNAVTESSDESARLTEAIEGIRRCLLSLRAYRDSIEQLNNMDALKDITSVEYAADQILSDLAADGIVSGARLS